MFKFIKRFFCGEEREPYIFWRVGDIYDTKEGKRVVLLAKNFVNLDDGKWGYELLFSTHLKRENYFLANDKGENLSNKITSFVDEVIVKEYQRQKSRVGFREFHFG